MATLSELFREGRNEELWKRCCGFIDLSLPEFMGIQSRLLREQLVLLKKCELGRHILGQANPETVNEFRELVPLTTYADYAPYLLKRKMDALPKKPILWQYTSGKYGEYAHRWAPVTSRQLEEIESLIMALVLFSGCKDRNEVSFNLNDNVFYGMAPPRMRPGRWPGLSRRLFNFLPPIHQAEETLFEERIKQGFEMALTEGLDLCLAMSSVTVAIGNRFIRNGGHTNLKALMKKPKVMARLAQGMVKSKLARRALLPGISGNSKA